MKKTIKSFILYMTIISILLLSFLLTSCAGFGGCMHEWDEGEVLIVPTDETSGLIAYVCQKCEETKVEKIDHIHEWSEGVIETNPETGKTFKMYSCLICDEVKIVDITDECDHTYNEGEVTTEPTCGEGVKTFTCTICGGKKEETIPPTIEEHTWVDPTCTAPKTCSVCGATEGEPLPHTPGEAIETAPTCGEDGKITISCTVCGTVISEEKNGDATGEHTYNEGVVTTEPTCQMGVMTYTCIVCESTKEEEIAPIADHTEEIIESLAPTCGKAGLTEGKKCTVCDTVTVEQTEIPPTGEHTYNEGEVTTEPTCEKEGEITYTCTVCNETKKETINALGHTWDEGAVTTAPTCEVQGEMTYKCTVDGCDGTKTEPIEPNGHDWDEGEVTTEPTCLFGVKTYKCTVDGCEGEKTEEISPIIDHDFEPTEETKITETGVYVVESCQNCQTTQNGAMVEGYNVISDDNIVINSNTTTIFYGDKNFGVITLSGTLENVTIACTSGAKISMVSVAGNISGLTLKNIDFATVSSVYYIETQTGSKLENAVIDNCTFDGKNLINNAIKIQSGATKNLTVTNCTFKDLDWSSIPIYIEGQENVGTVEISNNIADNFAERFVIINNVQAENISINDNTLSNWMYIEGTPTDNEEIVKISSTTATLSAEGNTLDGEALGELVSDDSGNAVIYADKTNESETPSYVAPEEPEPPVDEGVENI